MGTDVVIIGAGVVGCTTALELARAGVRVTLVDQGGVGRESSWAGGGILFPLLPWDYSGTVNALVRRSLELFPAWSEALKSVSGIDPEYRQCGMLVLPPFSTDKARAWCGANATKLEVLNAQTLIPALALNEDALWMPEVAQARNPRLLKALRRRLELLGVKINEHTEVTGWQSAGAVITGIQTNHGILCAEHFIVTSGAWSRQLLGEHALTLDISPIRGQMLLFKAEPGELPAIILKNGIYLIPRLDGHVLAGSTLEDVGFDKSTTQEARAMLYARASEILPLLKDVPLVRHWSGLRPGAPENVPVISRHPRLENLFVNSGHFRYGVTMAPASAEIMANLILDRPQTIDVEAYGWPPLRHMGI